MYGNQVQNLEFNDNQYEIINKIGDGGSARVYKAKKNQKEYVALSLQTQFYDEDVNNFTQLSSVSWRNCAVPKAVFRQDRKHLYCELPLFNGDVSKITLTEQQLEKLITQITQAIEDIHRDDFIHCDIKPLNILYRENQYALCDFGSLIKIGSDKQFFGTAYYSPPEVEKLNEFDKSADIWALGISLFEINQHEHFFCQPSQDEIERKKNDQNYIDNRILKISNLKLRYLIQEMVKIDLKSRITASAILKALKEQYNGKAILQSCKIGGIDLPESIDMRKFIRSQRYMIPNCHEVYVTPQTKENIEPAVQVRKISLRATSYKQS